MARWYDEIRDIHDNHFSDPWQERLREINDRYGLIGNNVLLTHGRSVPPPWFNGDIEAVREGNWVLIVSLNPRVVPSEIAAIEWYDNQQFTRDSYWDHWRRFNTNHWYWKFFRPRARLASRILGESINRSSEREFATERMLFVELCPYGSGKFVPPRHMIEALSATDQGFRLAAHVRRLLMDRGRPAVVIVNGNSAVEDFESLNGDALSWKEVCYQSVESLSGRRPGRMLWHRQGYYRGSDSVTLPVIGCPFLRSVRGFNWNSEIDQLGDRVRAFLQENTHEK